MKKISLWLIFHVFDHITVEQVNFITFAGMYKKIITFFMACLFLTGGILLPLGDFSLMQDIPDMYRNYAHITSEEEFGVIDFIGDYLMHGKEIFGHNKNDKPHGENDGVQFQHQANPLAVVFLQQATHSISFFKYNRTYQIPVDLFRPSDFREQLLRPPLV